MFDIEERLDVIVGTISIIGVVLLVVGMIIFGGR